MYLGRLLTQPDGFVSDPAFQFSGHPVLDPSHVYYYGNSQGGIAGGALTAVEPDVTRSVLYVPGMNYSLLLTRSVDFEDYASILYPAYKDEGQRPLLISLIQSMWDRGEPSGYANHMTTDPLPDTPSHKVLIEMSYGDHQVANVATEAEARTIGAPLRQPALDANRLPAGLRAAVLRHADARRPRRRGRRTGAACSSGTSVRSATRAGRSSAPTRRRSPTPRPTTRSGSTRTTP